MVDWLARPVDLGAESRDEAEVSREALTARAEALRGSLDVGPGTKNPDAAALSLELAAVLLEMDDREAAWQSADRAFRAFRDEQEWTRAIEALDLMFRSEQPASLAALGHSIWLAVTFPVDVRLTLAQLAHVVEHTPDDADGAAVAAATAGYIAELRRGSDEDPEVDLFVSQLLSQVARQHGGVREQADFDPWFRALELDNPDKFLVRLRNVIDVLVQDDWWIDRDAIQATLPE